MPATIAEQSAQVKTASAERLPAAVLDVFDRSLQDLRAQGVPTGAVAVGDTLEPFTLPDARDVPVTLDSLLETGPAVLVFYRGGWCPYCDLTLRTYERELLPELARHGASLVAISPQTPDASLSTAEKAELSYTVLSDRTNTLAAHLGITFHQQEDVRAAQRTLGLDITNVNGEDSGDLPMPTVLIVGTDRVVRFVDVRPDFTTRTEVSEILAALA